MKTCVFCISKLAFNIYDWIDYYLSLGFDHIFLIDNNEYNERYKIDDERVTVIHYPSEFKIQKDCKFKLQRQCLLTQIGLTMAYDQDYDYCFVCDDDEYLDLKGKYSNVKEFLTKYNIYDSISITWEMVDDNEYMYISDEPKDKSLREAYSHSIGMHTECKSFYKFPEDYETFKSDIFDGNIWYIIHNVTDRNRLHIYDKEIEKNEVTVKHYSTFCAERFLLKKAQYKGENPWLEQKYLEYYFGCNNINDEKLKIYVELCKKYNIELSENDRKILSEHNIFIE